MEPVSGGFEAVNTIVPIGTEIWFGAKNGVFYMKPRGDRPHHVGGIGETDAIVPVGADIFFDTTRLTSSPLWPPSLGKLMNIYDASCTELGPLRPATSPLALMSSPLASGSPWSKGSPWIPPFASHSTAMNCSTWPGAP
jgi:hypothetical protein